MKYQSLLFFFFFFFFFFGGGGGGGGVGGGLGGWSGEIRKNIISLTLWLIFEADDILKYFFFCYPDNRF